MSMFNQSVTSLWQQTAVPLAQPPQLRERMKADVTIIGAGITGLRAALELSKRNISVVVLDSHEPGWGASGRTGGQVNPLAHATPDVIIQQLGPVFGPRMLDAYINSASELFNLVKQHDLQCEAVQGGWLRGAHCESATKDLQKMYDGWSKIGLDISFVEGAELRRLSGSDAYKTATLVKSAGSLQPLSYSRELARVAKSQGADIFANSPVLNVKAQGGKWTTTTQYGEVVSDWVLHCTNGYTDNALKGLRQTIVPLISIQAATRPLTKAEYDAVLPEGHTLADTRRVIYYSRKDNRNRLLFGSLGTAESCARADKQRLLRSMRSVFPQFCEEDLEYHWGGRVAFTPDVLPHLHEPAPGQLAGLGYNGRGVAMATVMGRVLAERVAGKPAEDLPIPTTGFKSVPFHGFHKVGVVSAIKYFEFRDNTDAKFF
ncbi:FAD-binding oxidoreductase [Pseudomonas sp. MS19]|uniref:NAD(P)/FAD-dependent oxidoreductase n=1 Tax=Pseudomonas sp. MS19 TaxID=2579939 RepID=UPI001561E4D4|nr:FAD-binding oxidoreductase [Pseudomonas sp. MS19]